MSKTILFADDETWVLQGIKDGLDAAGYQVITAANGSEALEKLRANAIDLLLLDVMMPPGDEIDEVEAGYGRRTGVEVLKVVRREEPRLPVICLTVVMDRNIHNELKKLGATILEKPVVPSEIVRRVGDKLGH